MKNFKLACFALAVALLSAVPADAQQNVFVMNRGMLGIRHEPVGNNPVSRKRVVVEVVKGSPADKAGVLKGDTILSINGLAATSAVMAALEPGDTVAMRVKRGRNERTLSVVAAATSNSVFSATRSGQTRNGMMLPDTVMGNISIIMDRIHSMTDSSGRRATVRVQTINGDSIVTYELGDSVFRFAGGRGNIFRTMPDSSFRGVYRTMPAELNMFFSPDSLLGTRFRMLHPDSMQRYIFRGGVGDSIFDFTVNGMFNAKVDTMHLMRPGQIFENGFSMGMRAVAGAELSEMNAGLAEYFGTAGGVLVTNARVGTPAEKAGLRSGDVILSVNRANVRSIPELRRAIDNASGRTVQLRVLRRGQNVDVTLNRD